MGYTNRKLMISDNSSDANFRSWGKAISDEFAAAGWAKTADTGQVNWTTVTVPSSAYAYEIWQPQDALQTGGSVFYVKIEYGFNSTNGPRLRVQVGTGTDGSGNLTGLTTTQTIVSSTSTNQGSSQFVSYFSGDTDRFCMVLWKNGSNLGHLIGFERTKATDGSNTGEGVTVFLAGFASSPPQGQETLIFAAGAGPKTLGRTFIALIDGNNASGAFNNNIPISPAFPQYGQYGNPHTIVGFVHSQDVAEETFFTTTLYSATRTYVALTGLNYLTPANTRLAMRYD